MAADVLHQALTSGDAAVLWRLYEERLQAEYGLYYRVARAFVRAIGRPAGDASLHGHRACTAAASWSGCCASCPTCSGPTRSGRPRPPTKRWWPSPGRKPAV